MPVAALRPEDAVDYDRAMGAWSAVVAERFLDWLSPPSGLDWLDLGCGTGALTEALHQSCAPSSLYGLDPAEAYTAVARRRPVGRFAQFAEGAAEDLPFGARSFDAVALGLAVCHLPQPRKALAEVRRVLRPGGLVAAYVWALPEAGHPLAGLHDIVRRMGLPMEAGPAASVCSQVGLETLWTKAGLDEVRTHAIEISLNFPDFDSLWALAQLCTACGPGLRSAEPAQLRAVCEAYRQALRAVAATPLHLTGRAWAVRGIYRGVRPE